MAAKKPSTPLAWVGSITAVFSLIAGIYGGWAFLSGQLERRRAIDRLLAAEAVQLHSSDYESAWNTLAQAATIDSSSARVQQAQEDVAMQWLDNIRISGDQTFASITEKLEPVLIRGVASAKSPQRQADLMAHLGWSYFLRAANCPLAPIPSPPIATPSGRIPPTPTRTPCGVTGFSGTTKASRRPRSTSPPLSPPLGPACALTSDPCN